MDERELIALLNEYILCEIDNEILMSLLKGETSDKQFVIHEHVIYKNPYLTDSVILMGFKGFKSTMKIRRTNALAPIETHTSESSIWSRIMERFSLVT